MPAGRVHAPGDANLRRHRRKNELGCRWSQFPIMQPPDLDPKKLLATTVPESRRAFRSSGESERSGICLWALTRLCPVEVVSF